MASAVVALSLGVLGCSTASDTQSDESVETAVANESSEAPADTSEVPKQTDPTIPVIEAEQDSGLTSAQKNAAKSAESYLEFSGFSRQGLIDQLSSEYGDKFAVEDATAAVESLDVDWNLEAVESAKSYLEMQGFSCQGLIEQLSSEFGDKYTLEEATYGATEAGAC